MRFHIELFVPLRLYCISLVVHFTYSLIGFMRTLVVLVGRVLLKIRGDRFALCHRLLLNEVKIYIPTRRSVPEFNNKKKNIYDWTRI